MLDFQQKRKIRSVAYHRVTLSILFIIVLIFAHSTWTVFQKKRLSQEAKNISLKNVEELRLRDNDLKSKIEKLKTNSGVEEEIRSKFNVLKDKENMVVIVENQSSGTSTPSPNVSLWQRFLGFLRR